MKLKAIDPATTKIFVEPTKEEARRHSSSTTEVVSTHEDLIRGHTEASIRESLTKDITAAQKKDIIIELEANHLVLIKPWSKRVKNTSPFFGGGDYR